MHPITLGRARHRAFLANPLRRGALIVALAAALTAAGCHTPTTPSPPAAPGLMPPKATPQLSLHDCDDLMVGDRTNGNCVTALQLLLNTRGAQLPAVGVFDKHTLERVLQFQRARGLPTTGLVGELTKKALYEYPPEGEEWNLTTECVDLYQGTEGPCAQSLQRLLIQYGEQAPDSGRYGPDTAEAVRRFQHNHDLPESGVADSMTKQALYDQLSSVAPRNWRAQVDNCPGPNCTVTLDHATVADIAKNLDTGVITRGFLELIGSYILHFACAAVSKKAPGVQILCEKVVEWTVKFIAGKFLEASAGQTCVQISFLDTQEGLKPAELNQTERCPT